MISPEKLIELVEMMTELVEMNNAMIRTQDKRIRELEAMLAAERQRCLNEVEEEASMWESGQSGWAACQAIAARISFEIEAKPND